VTARRPVIGIPTQTLQVMDGIPKGLPPSWVMNQRYYLVAAAVGAVPWMIPLIEDTATLREIYDRLDGVLLAGGVDMDPATYGEARTPLCGVIDRARDLVELELARWAIQDGKPLFGICRGLQVINVALGGTLYQDLAAECGETVKHDYLPNEGWRRDHVAHDVSLAAGGRLQRSFGASHIAVNSMHHQGIERLGQGLRVTAVAPDGLIEGIETPDRYVVAVQWHPESMPTEHSQRILTPFIEACRAAA
jgi:putative glutamine amidotransferase